jgi:hypothetical protein
MQDLASGRTADEAYARFLSFLKDRAPELTN